MARPCTVCASPDREAIDRAIVERVPHRTIAHRHAASRDAVTRHAKSHVPRALVAVVAHREAQGAESLTDRIEQLYARASAILDANEDRPTVALAAVRELRSVVELLARITGELDERPTTNVVNLVASDDWIAIRSAVLDALAPYPDARAAVASRLLALNEGAAS